MHHLNLICFNNKFKTELFQHFYIKQIHHKRKRLQNKINKIKFTKKKNLQQFEN